MLNKIENKFAVLLAKRRLKISKVSKDTGISRTTLTSLYYEKTKSISLETLNKLCEYLQCDVNDIFEVVNNG